MRIKSSTSFSLLEIIVAMLILSLVVAGLFGLFVTSFKFIVEAGNRQQALNYARTVAEHLKVYVSADPNISPTITTAGTEAGCVLHAGEHDPSEILPAATLDDIPDGFTIENYNIVEDVNGTDCEQVTITVTYPEL